jgi:hypothetical protein
MDWKDELPDDLKADPTLASFKDVASLARSMIETKKMVGSSLRSPGPDATPEQRKEYLAKVLQTAPELVVADDDEALYKRLGRPEKVEEYVVDEVLAKSIDLEDARKQALAAGLTKKQFQVLAKQTADAKAALVDAEEKAHAALRQEWGFAHADRVLAAAVAARKMGMSDATVAEVASGKVPAAQMKFLYQASKIAGVDSKELTLEREGHGGGRTPDPSEARAQQAEIRGNPAYWDRRINPMLHDQLKEKMVKLTMLAS